MTIQDILNKLPDNTARLIKEKDLRECFAGTWDKMLKRDLSDLTDAEKQNIKTILGIGTLPTNIATIDQNGNLGNAYTKEQIKAIVDNQINTLKDGVGSAYDTLKEIETYINADTTATASIVQQLSTKAPLNHAHFWSDLTDKPTSFTPTAHTHDISQITGVISNLSNTNLTIPSSTIRSLTFTNAELRFVGLADKSVDATYGEVVSLNTNGTLSRSKITSLNSQQNTISASRTLADSDFNKLNWINANVVITIPTTGISDNFTCEFRVLTGGTLQIVGASGVALVAINGDKLKPNKHCSIIRRGNLQEYHLIGETSL